MLAIQYSEAEYKNKYEELRQYKVTIPADPISQGFGGLAALISTVQGSRDRITEVMNEALYSKSLAKKQELELHYAYETALDVIIDTDPEITNLTSDRQRLARANQKLKAQIADMREATIIYHLFDCYYKTVCNVLHRIESADKSLSEQINIYKRMNPPLPFAPLVPGTVRTELP